MFLLVSKRNIKTVRNGQMTDLKMFLDPLCSVMWSYATDFGNAPNCAQQDTRVREKHDEETDLQSKAAPAPPCLCSKVSYCSFNASIHEPHESFHRKCFKDWSVLHDSSDFMLCFMTATCMWQINWSVSVLLISLSQCNDINLFCCYAGIKSVKCR